MMSLEDLLFSGQSLGGGVGVGERGGGELGAMAGERRRRCSQDVLNEKRINKILQKRGNSKPVGVVEVMFWKNKGKT